MRSEDRNKLNRIEELKGKLFSKNSPIKIEHRDSFSHLATKDVPDAWADKGEAFRDMSEKFFTKTSFFKKFFIFSAGFFILALGYASYMFFAKGNTVSNDNISITILGNAFTSGGEELPLQISIANKNSSALDLVDLIVEYPKSSQSDLPGGVERIRESLGTIPAGAVRNENVKIVIFGEQGSVRPVKVSIEYRVEGSNAIFVKSEPYDVNINSTPINLSVDAPDTISPNQDINLNIEASLNSPNPVAKMLVRVDYPVGFQFTKSTPPPSYGNNVWDLGDLAPGASHTIAINGKMVDVFDGEEKIFHVWTGSQSPTDKSIIGIVFNSTGQTVTIKKPSIEANLYINDTHARTYATDSKSPVFGQIRWANNLETNIDDLEIRAKISGNALNRKTVTADQGFYDSLNNTIVWDKNSVSRFREINPGDSGFVNFSISALSLFSGSDGILKDPTMNIEITVAGKQAISGYELKNLTNSESATVLVISDVGLATKALYYSGPFTNTGLIPPKVEKETTYTIVWSLSNTANTISKTQIHSTLPSWVRFTGAISPPSEDLSYNQSTREITWNVGSIQKGTGLTAPSREVAFTVALTPSLSQVGASPVLINDTTLTGHDDFANVDVRVNKISLNTALLNDSALPPGGGRVVE